MVARSMPKQKPGRSKQTYGTPQVFIAAVVKRFGTLHFDLAASATNAKADSYYTARQNALTCDWIAGPKGEEYRASYTCWLNPPYSYLLPWIRKCDRERHLLTSGQILVLVPASVGSTWFRDWVWNKASVYFLDERISFISNQPYPKDLMLLRYRKPSLSTPITIWSWRADKLIKQR